MGGPPKKNKASLVLSDKRLSQRGAFTVRNKRKPGNLEECDIKTSPSETPKKVSSPCRTNKMEILISDSSDDEGNSSAGLPSLKKIQSSGCTPDQPISFCDDDLPVSLNARTSMGSTKEDPIVLSDGESSVTSTTKPFIMPAWSPRSKRVEKPSKSTKNSGKSSPRKNLLIYIDTSSSDGEDVESYGPLKKMCPRRKRTLKKKPEVFCIDVSSSDESEVEAHGPLTQMGPRKTTKLKQKPEKLRVVESDSSDDDYVIPPAAFSSSRRKQQNSKQKTSTSRVLEPALLDAANESCRTAVDQSEAPIPESRLIQRSAQHEESKADKSVQDKFDRNDGRLLKSPPKQRSPKYSQIKAAPLGAKLQTESDLQRKTLKAPPQEVKPTKIGPTHYPTSINTRLYMDRKSIPTKDTTSLAKNLFWRSNSGAAHGSHLAPIFRNALKANQPLDVKGRLSPMERKSLVLRLERERLQRQRLLPHQTLSKTGTSSGLDYLQECDVSLSKPPILPVKRKRLPNMEKYQDDSSVEHKTIISQETELSVPNDANFKGGEDDPVDYSNVGEKGCMTNIDHLSSTYMDKHTGLPVSKLSVFGEQDDIIYDFELKARKSGLPNAGNGVFLTFLGARELKPSRRKRGEKLIEDRSYHVKQKLAQAIHPDGFGMSVKFTGEDLHAPYNVDYLLPDLEAAIPDSHNSGKKTRVVFSDWELPYSEDELAAMRDPTNRIGFLKIHKESDYVPAPKRTFSWLHKNCGWIDIGRYGPFRKADRKTETQFNIKSFIFSNEPSEWCFGVPEDLADQIQLIDITDDMTGEPSEIAKRNIPMYVNEVGYSTSLKHTVHSCEKEDRTVQYFLKVEDPMRAGDCIEILVDYFEGYEDVRNRKGYGRSNLDGLEKSDDDFATLMQRNFIERQEIEGIIEDMSLWELYSTLEGLESMGGELSRIVGEFLKAEKELDGSSPSSYPTGLQLVALRRLTWLASIFKRRLETLKMTPTEPPEIGQGVFVQCATTISRLNRPSWGDVFDLLARKPGLVDKNGVEIKKKFDIEVTEEICYRVKMILVSPANECLWCDIAIGLTMRLCNAIANVLWRCPNPSTAELNSLIQTFMEEAKGAAQEVCNPYDLKRLSFCSCFRGICGLSNGELTELGKWNKKGGKPERVVISSNGEADASFKPPTSKVPLGIPKTMTSIVDQPQMLQKTWYLCWQVMYIVYAFSSKFLPNFPLEVLCSSLGVPFETLSDVIQHGLKNVELSAVPSRRRRKHGREGGKQRSSSVSKTSKRKYCSEKSKRKDGPLGPKTNNFLFWNIIWPCLKDELNWSLMRGNRPKDFYALPPGVALGKGFRNRVDFFDSTRQVMQFITTNPSWSEVPQIKKCLRVYSECKELYEQLKKTKRMPKFGGKDEMTSWLKCQVTVSAK